MSDARRRSKSRSRRARRSSACTDSSRCSSFVSSSFVCERPRRLWTKSITVGMPARETSAASWSGPLGRRCDVPGDLADRLVGELDQLLVEQDRLDLPDPLPLDLDVLLVRRSACEAASALLSISASCAASRCRWSSRHSAVSTTEVTMPGFVTTPPIVQTAPPPMRRRDLADLELQLRGAGERVAALVHRRRARVRRLAAPRDAMALDAERAEHDAERQVHRSRAPAPARCAARGRRPRSRAARAPRARGRGRLRAPRSRPAARCRRRRVSCRSSSWSAIEPAAALEPNSERPKRAPSSSAQLTSRTVTARLALLGDPPQHLDAGHDVQRAVEPAAVRHRVDVPADEQRALASRPRSVNHWLPRLVDLHPRSPSSLPRSQSCAPAPTCPSRPRAARRRRRRSAPAARAARRRCASGRAASPTSL